MSIMPQDPDSKPDTRGICATCGRTMQVRPDGLVRRHRDDADQRCRGGGLPPFARETPDGHRAELDADVSHRLRLVAALQWLTLTQALSEAIDFWLAEKDPEEFCPACFADMESSEHHEKCGDA